MSVWLLPILLMPILPAFAHAATLRVTLHHSGQYARIQTAVDAARSGDTVLVADGTYSGPGNRDIDFHGKSLTVTSEHGAVNTIIDCGGYRSPDGSGNHRGFYIHSGERKATIRGFTVRNGFGVYVSNADDSGEGGGVFLSARDGGTVTLSDCTVAGNTTRLGGGGGIYNASDSNGAVTVINCAIFRNSAQFGGGGVCNFTHDGGTVGLTNCTIFGNTDRYSGGGVKNTKYGGAGVGDKDHSNGGTITLNHCTVSGNTARTGGGVYGNGVLTDCILYSDIGGETGNDGSHITHLTAMDSDVQGGYPGTGNIDADPLFVNARAGDLRLKAGSPCTGNGVPVGALMATSATSMAGPLASVKGPAARAGGLPAGLLVTGSRPMHPRADLDRAYVVGDPLNQVN